EAHGALGVLNGRPPPRLGVAKWNAVLEHDARDPDAIKPLGHFGSLEIVSKYVMPAPRADYDRRPVRFLRTVHGDLRRRDVTQLDDAPPGNQRIVGLGLIRLRGKDFRLSGGLPWPHVEGQWLGGGCDCGSSAADNKQRKKSKRRHRNLPG